MNATQAAKRLLFLTQYDENGASSRIRIYQFLPYFREQGFEVEVRPLIKSNANKVFKAFATAGFFQLVPTLLYVLSTFRRRLQDVFLARKFDAVVVQKDVMPFGLGMLLRFFQKRIIYEFDDPIWMSHPSSGGKVFLLSTLITTLRRYALVRMLKRSKLVIVDNDLLKKFAQTYCPNVTVLTSPIDTKRYTVVRQEDPNHPSFGWIGSPGTFYMLTDILPLLEHLGKQFRFRLYNIGGLDFTSEYFEVVNVPWSFENELKYLSIFDVGLMPIDDLPFNNAKFGYKVVQYFCAGVPTLATDVGLNRVAIEENVTGLRYKMNDKQDFSDKALKLFRDSELRHRLGANARQLALQQYDLGVLAKQFIRSVEEVS